MTKIVHDDRVDLELFCAIKSEMTTTKNSITNVSASLENTSTKNAVIVLDYESKPIIINYEGKTFFGH